MSSGSRRWPRGFAGRALPLGWRQSHNYGDPGGPRFALAPRPPERATDRVQQLHVATYNVELVRRAGAVLDLLEREPRLGQADILALQEADEALVEQAARRLGMGYVFYPSMLHPLTDRNFGPAILTRWPVLDDGKVPLPGRGWTRGSRRIAVRATIQLPGIQLRVYDVHLSTMWEMLPSAQDAQARAVVEDAASSEIPVLVAGDLNRMGAGQVFARAGYEWPTRRVGRTHHVWSFDHVFIRGIVPAGVTTGSVAEALATSDHRAVWTVLTLPPG